MIYNIKNKSYDNIIKLCVNLCNFVVIVLYDHDTYTLSQDIRKENICRNDQYCLYIHRQHIFRIFSCRKGAVVTKY